MDAGLRDTGSMGPGSRDLGTQELHEQGVVTIESKALTALTARGISPQQASRLTRGRSGASLQRILDIVAYYDRLCSMKSKLVSRSPIGFLYRAVESPESFILPADKNIPGASSLRPAQGALALQGEAHRPDSTGRQHAVSRDAVARDKLAELQASYLESRRRAVQQMKLDVEPSLLSKITQEVEAALAKLRSLISPKRFQETVDHGIEERLVKMFLFPEFDEWIQKQRLGAH